MSASEKLTEFFGDRSKIAMLRSCGCTSLQKIVRHLHRAARTPFLIQRVLRFAEAFGPKWKCVSSCQKGLRMVPKVPIARSGSSPWGSLGWMIGSASIGRLGESSTCYTSLGVHAELRSLPNRLGGMDPGRRCVTRQDQRDYIGPSSHRKVVHLMALGEVGRVKGDLSKWQEPSPKVMQVLQEREDVLWHRT